MGGNALALHGLFEPLLYCDISNAARKTLAKNIKRGLLPPAPILQDVRSLTKDQVGGKVDAIVASFPCQGLSPLGLRNGFQHKETGLFSEIVRLVDELAPDIVFMENVPNVLNKEMHRVTKDLGSRGFELRWVVLGAHSLGAPQVRNRWFCLCLRHSAYGKTWDNLTPRDAFEWKDPPRRTVPPLEDMYRSTRCALLGNSVVPDVVRMAFFHLASGFGNADPFCGGSLAIEDMEEELLESDFRFEEEIASYPRAGVYREGIVYPRPLPVHERPNIGIRLVSELPKTVSKKVRSPLVTCTTLRTWSTPRKGMVMSCRVLTERSARDLPTQVVFAEDTPDEDRKYQISANWVEWLMGYPQNYTRFED